MYVVLTVLTILFSLFLVITDWEKRFLLFIISITFLPYGFEITNKLLAPRILLISFFISVIIRYKEYYCKYIPCKKYFIIVAISYALTGFFDQRVSLLGGFSKFLVAFMETFGALLLGFASYKGPVRNSKSRIMSCILILSLLVSLYSFLCYVINADPFSISIGDTDSMTDDRQRIASFFFNSHMAGFAISIYIILLLYYKQEYKFSFLQNMIIIFMFIALLLTKSRSSLLDLIAGCLILYGKYIFLSRNRIKYIILGLCSFLFLYSIIGPLMISSFSDAFQQDGGETGGSNIIMRLQQLFFSYELFLRNPVFGNGFNYFWENIKNHDNYLSSMLLGAESYIFILLIERGAIQIVTIFIYFVSLFCFLSKKKLPESNLCIALLTAFLVNSILTGNTYKWIFIMPFIGYYMKQIQINKL